MPPLTFKERGDCTAHPTAKKLFELMERKQTNLALAADVTCSSDLLKLLRATGKHICVLKTHIDILDDFSPQVTYELKKLAQTEDFLIFEDRKFADIGSTVKHQYAGGIYRIADWADMINAHIIPGEGIIEGLRTAGQNKGRGLLLLAEMSSKGNLATGAYTQKAIDFALQYPDFVMGFIAQRKLTSDPTFLHFTPGVQLEEGGDALGQQYHTPESVIGAGSDIIIVGRDIYQHPDPEKIAHLYRQRGWNAYTKAQETRALC